METPISPKVTVATLAGAITTIIVWILDAAVHLAVPAPVTVALTVVIMAAVAWVTRDRLRDAGQAAANATPTTPVGQLAAVALVKQQQTDKNGGVAFHDETGAFAVREILLICAGLVLAVLGFVQGNQHTGGSAALFFLVMVVGAVMVAIGLALATRPERHRNRPTRL